MTHRATIKALRSELDVMRCDMWTLAGENADIRRANRGLSEIIDRQDETILALWGLIDQQADEAPSDCEIYFACADRDACTASYAEGCGAYVGKETP